MGFCSRGQILGSSPNATKKWGFIAKKQGGGSLDRKLLRGNMRGKEGFWLST